MIKCPGCKIELFGVTPPAASTVQDADYTIKEMLINMTAQQQRAIYKFLHDACGCRI